MMSRRILLATVSFTLLIACIMLPSLAAGNAAFDWPQWRGPERTDVSKETGLLKSWPEGGPARLWMFEDAGKGYSGFSVVGGKLYTMGSRNGTELLIALDAEKGTELWAAEIGKELGNRWGDGPRGTPTVDGDRVYALGGQGNLICASVKDGKIAWQKSMQSLGGKVPGWGYCESVLVDGDQVVCTPGGDEGAIVALNKMSGEVVWQSKDFKDGAQYASIIAADHGGKRHYIQLTMQSIVGIDAANGSVLWKSDWPGRTAVIPTPIFHDGHVYVTAGYGVGCKLVKITGEGATEVYFNQDMKNHHGGVVLYNGHLYGYSDGPGWICQNFMTGETVWRDKSLGKGALTIADGMMYCIDEDRGQVVLAAASPDGWKESGRFTLDPQTKIRSSSGRIWTHPVVSNGKLYLRDQDLIYCYDIKAK